MGSISVVVTVGTDHHPFDRLVEWVERWAAGHPEAELFVQRGTSRAPVGVDSAELVPHAELCERMAAADVVVVQGGPGGIIDSIRSGVKPIVVPRRHDLGEHVDDHQVAFARVMAEEGRVEKAETESELVALLDALILDKSRLRQTPTPSGGDAATAARIGEMVQVLVRGGNSNARSSHVDGAAR